MPIPRINQLLESRGSQISLPRLGIWVWAFDLKTQANCDNLIAFATGKFTDLFIFAIDDGVSPKTWLGTGTLGTSDATVIGGKTPWQYVYDKAHSVGIKVHGWMWLQHFSYWGGALGIDSDIPDNSTYNTSGTYNFHNATARSAMVDEIVDFVGHNSIDGIHLNLEGTMPDITEQDITDFVSELRWGVPNKEFSFCVGGDTSHDSALKINMEGLLRTGLIEDVVIMGYYDPLELASAYVASLRLDRNHPRIIRGWGAETVEVRPSDFRHRLVNYKKDGYINFAIFCWGSDVRDDSGLQDAIEEYLNGSLVATQAPITKVSLTPNVSWTITVDGADQTTLYSEVTTHTGTAQLKQHIESALGTTNPAILYRRIGSTVTTLLIGDYEP